MIDTAMPMPSVVASMLKKQIGHRCNSFDVRSMDVLAVCNLHTRAVHGKHKADRVLVKYAGHRRSPADYMRPQRCLEKSRDIGTTLPIMRSRTDSAIFFIISY